MTVALLVGCEYHGSEALRDAVKENDSQGAVKVLRGMHASVTTDERGQITHIDIEPLAEFTEINLVDDDLDQLRRLATQGGLDHLVSLDLAFSRQITAKGISHLGALPRLERLRLFRVPLADSAFVHLAPLEKLVFLDLSVTGITSKEMPHLSKLTNLRELRLECAQISDDALSTLSGLTKLETLMLRDTPIHGTGIRHLKGLRRLTTLDLRLTELSDNGLATVCELTQLRSLDIGDTFVTTAGIKHLEKLPNLTELGLARTDIGDAALESLSRLLKLEKLDLSNRPRSGRRALRI